MKLINERKRLRDLTWKIDNNFLKIKLLLIDLNSEERRRRRKAGIEAGMDVDAVFKFYEEVNFFQKEEDDLKQLENSLQAILPEMPREIDNSDDPKYWTNDRFNLRRLTIAYHEEKIKQYENQLKDVEPQLKEYESRVNQLKNELPEPERKK